MIVALDCKLRDSYFKADEKLDSLKDVVLSIDGGFGSPEFFMTVYKYTLTHISNNDVLDIQTYIPVQSATEFISASNT